MLECQAGDITLHAVRDIHFQVVIIAKKAVAIVIHVPVGFAVGQAFVVPAFIVKSDHAIGGMLRIIPV